MRNTYTSTVYSFITRENYLQDIYKNISAFRRKPLVYLQHFYSTAYWVKMMTLAVAYLIMIPGSWAQKKATPVITWSTPVSITYGTPLSSTQLYATANVAGSFKYTPPAGTVLNAGTQTLSTTFTPTNKSAYNSATASVSLVVNRATATITLSNLNQTYDGNPKPVTVTTSPTGVATTVTYTGSNVSYTTSTTAPTNPGSYTVVAKVTDGNYTGADATGTLIISSGTSTKIDPVITWTNPSPITYGTALNKKQLNATANVAGSFKYTPPAGTVLNAGTQTLSTTFTPTNTPQYNTVSKSVTLIVNKAKATVSLGNLTQTYDGSPKPITVTTSPAGLATSITYNGSTTVPANAGSYSVIATVTDPNYTGSSSGTLVINKSGQTITFNALSNYTYGDPSFTLNALASSGLPVSYSIVSGPATISDNTVTITGAGSVTIRAAQGGNNNYNAAASVDQTTTIAKAQATLTLSTLSFNYDGYPKLISVTTDPAGLSGVSVTYDGSATAPSAVGSYSVMASLDNPNYQAANATGTLIVTEVTKATPVISWVPAAITYGTPLSAAQLNATADVAGTFTYTPAAGTILNAGTQSLSVDFTPADGTNYNSVTGTTVSLAVGKASLLYRADDKIRSYGQSNPKFIGRFLKANIVILGSSTAAGTGASSPATSWAGLLTNQLNNIDYPGLVNVINLAHGSNTTYTILPTGTDNGSTRPAVDPTRNITAALALSPQIIIINLPSNDVSAGYALSETMNNFATIINTARAAGVKVLLTGAQPDGSPTSCLCYRTKLRDLNQSLVSTYGSDCINIYDELVQLPDYWLKDVYNSGDYTHLGDAGHAYVYSQLYPSVKAWIEANGSGFVNNESSSNLSGQASFATTATTSSPAGSYAIVPGGFSSDNYTIVYANGILTVAKAVATVSLSNLNQTYDGTPKPVTVTTTPAGLATTVTYNGSSTVPTDAGSYNVAVTIMDPNYIPASATGTLVIDKAAATITLNNFTQVYDGTGKSIAVTTDPAGLAYSVTYDGGTTIPSAIGSYAVVVSLDNPNYTATDATGTLVISENVAPASITLSNLTPVYDGTAKAPTVTTDPAGLSYSITYDGDATAPTNVGSYAVSATITDPAYSGTTAGTLVIGKATPVISWVPAAITYGTALGAAQLNATADVAGTFTYTPAAGTILNAGTQTLSVDFTPADGTNYNSVTGTTASLAVGKASLLYRADDKIRSYGQSNPKFSGRFLKANIVILGSSTAAGTGASSPATSWAGLLTNQLNNIDYPGLVNVINLAQGGYTTYQFLPTGTDNGSTRPAVDPARNITAALALSPQIIIINLPSNDVSAGYALSETMNNFATIINTARAAGVKVLLTGTQPDGSPTSCLCYRTKLRDLNQMLLDTYGSSCINIYDELVQLPDYWLKDKYNSGNYTHLNDAGHAYVYSQLYSPVKARIEANGSGFVNNESSSNLSGQASFATTATTSSPAGSYAIVPGGFSSDNYTIVYANGILIVAKAVATVSLSNLNQTYDGTPKAVTVTTTPAGLAPAVTYNGSTTVPTNTGSYNVVATVTDPNYKGSASGTLVISNNALANNQLVTNRTFEVDKTIVKGVSLTYWPNPVVDKVTIRLRSEKANSAVAQLYDIRGILVKQVYIGKVEAGYEKTVEMSVRGLSGGTYILNVRIGSERISGKLVVTSY